MRSNPRTEAALPLLSVESCPSDKQAGQAVVRREVVAFEAESSRLWATIDWPSPCIGLQPVGVVMCNSDDGCRLGPHRLWVRLAEGLCAKGFVCCRFDYRGCGDSEGPEGPPPGDVGLRDVLAAERLLRHRAGVAATVLVGICYGAEVALLAGRCCQTVRGVVACSAGRYVTTEGYSRVVRHARAYLAGYARKLGRPAAWRKLFRGRVAVRTILGGLGAVLSTSAHQRDRAGAAGAEAIVRGCQHRPPSLFIYGSADPLHERYAHGYRREADEQGLQRSFLCIEGADHNFSRLAWSEQVIRAIETFVENSTDFHAVHRDD